MRIHKSFMMFFVLLSITIIAVIGQGYSEKIKFNLSKEFNKDMQEYRNDNPKLIYEVPTDWEVEVKKSNNTSYYYSIFQSEDSKIYGYLEVQPIKDGLLEKVKKGKKLDSNPLKDNVDISSKKYEDKEMVFIEYTMDTNKNNKVFEYYIFKKDKYLKLVTYSKGNSDYYKKMVDEIIGNIKY